MERRLTDLMEQRVTDLVEQRLHEHRRITDQRLPNPDWQAINPRLVMMPTPHQAISSDGAVPMLNNGHNLTQALPATMGAGPLPDSLGQQTPPPDPAPADHTLHNSQEHESYTETLEGAIRDWPLGCIASPNDATTRTQGVSNNDAVIEELKQYAFRASDEMVS